MSWLFASLKTNTTNRIDPKNVGEKTGSISPYLKTWADLPNIFMKMCKVFPSLNNQNEKSHWSKKIVGAKRAAFPPILIMKSDVKDELNTDNLKMGSISPCL